MGRVILEGSVEIKNSKGGDNQGPCDLRLLNEALRGAGVSEIL